MVDQHKPKIRRHDSVKAHNKAQRPIYCESDRIKRSIYPLVSTALFFSLTHSNLSFTPRISLPFVIPLFLHYIFNQPVGIDVGGLSLQTRSNHTNLNPASYCLMRDV